MAKKRSLGGKNTKRSFPKDPSLKERVNAHEVELADKLDGKRQPNSGALEQHKGDIKLDNFLLDSKETSTGGLLVTKRDLMKINKEAYQEGKEPGLILTIYDMAPVVPREWVMVPLEVFYDLVKQKEED